ncbi:hypothetical protein ACHAPJ_009293 [Fusarium lateritium]
MYLAAALFVLAGAIILARRWWFYSDKQQSLDTEKEAKEPDFIDVSRIKPTKPHFEWRSQEQTPYRPWRNGPYHVTMGLKNTDVENWIDLDYTYLEKYTLKKQLYREHRDGVLSVLPGCDDAAFEALELLKETLVRRYPSMFKLRDQHTIENLVTGDIWDLRRKAPTWEKHHPLEVMGLLATEDFFLLFNDLESGTTTLKAAGVCFPAGFKIEEKMGQNLWQIHAGKVPQYESKLAKSMDRFFIKLKVESAICRFNYAIDDSGELFHRHSHHNLTLEQLQNPPTLEDLHLRVERQVLQRLPKTRALLFSIRTYVTPITEVTEDLDIARALWTNVSSFDADVAKYKNKSLWEGTLQRHLAEVLGEDINK